MSKLGGTIVIVLFGAFWCGMTFFADGAFLLKTTRQLLASGYVETAGTITHSEVKFKHDGDGDSHSPDVRYKYQVAGKDLEGERIRYDMIAFSKRRSLEIVQRYPVNQAVTVYYDPAMPTNAVLEREPDIANLLAFLFLAPFNAVAFGFVGGFLAWRRSKRLDRPVLGVSVRDDGLSVSIRIYDFSPALSTLVAWGTVGFLSTFGVLLASWVMSLESAVTVAWSTTLAAIFLGWRYARKRYIEIRRNTMQGTVEIRERDGAEFSLAETDLRPCRYSSRTDIDSEGDRTEKYPVELPYFDPASQQPRILKLPEQSSEDDAVLFVTWLNRVLGLVGGGKQDESATILER